ncbi:MAG: thioredoxin family protein [Bacteroidota bacterium]
MHTTQAIDYKARMATGLTYDEYLATWQAHMAMPLKGLDKNARKYLFYARYNAERSGRVESEYKMDQKLADLIDSIAAPQDWLILTEDWCVDSAYALPIISKAAARNPHINLRILLRDDNLDIMDQHLTDGGRSIPKLIAFGAEGTELFQWGPRPDTLKQLRETWKAAGIEGPKLSEQGVVWYEEGGWQMVETELIDAIANSEVLV